MSAGTLPPTTAAEAHERFRGTRNFAALDGLRALSIVAVIWHHAADPSGPWGYMGVSLFFAISGFLITTLLLREQLATGTISLRNFFIRRALRIFPLYYAVLALYVALVLATERGSAPGQEFLANLPYFLTYTSNWYVDLSPGTRTIFYFAWTLATEEQFYLFWPVVVLAGRRWPVPVAVMGALLVTDLAVESLAAGGIVPATLPVRMVTSLATPIALGCLAAYAVDRPRSFAVVWRVLGGRWSTAALLAGVVVATAARSPELVSYALHIALAVAACVRVGRPAPVLGHRVLVSVGAVTYGMYLLHMLALNVVRRAIPGEWQTPVALFVCTAIVSFAAAQVSYHTYERWFLRFKDRFRASLPAHRPVAAVAPAVPDPGVAASLPAISDPVRRQTQEWP